MEEAMRLFLLKHIIPTAKKYDYNVKLIFQLSNFSQIFKKTLLWTEKIDTLFKINLKLM